ncbi:MAG: hypothetical protein P8Y69_08975, partial [Gammaproteobacteria bacterium]
MTATANVLSPVELAAYRRDGFLVRERVFSDVEIVTFQDAAERASARAIALCRRGQTYLLDGKRFVDVGHMTVQFEHSPGSELVKVIEPVHELDPAFDALVDDPRMVVPMRQLVGSDRVALG